MIHDFMHKLSCNYCNFIYVNSILIHRVKLQGIDA